VVEVSVILTQKMNADQVAPNLWVGGLPTDFESVDKNFDALVLAAKQHQDFFPVHKFPGTYVLHVPLDDAKPSREEKVMALQAGLKVYELNKEGKKVLVTCAAGVNRSAMIAAMAMIIGGVSADEAIKRIRKRRHPVSGAMPLFNTHFVKLLQDVDAALSTRTR
jgi:protein-tyrosine phosphatase